MKQNHQRKMNYQEFKTYIEKARNQSISGLLKSKGFTPVRIKGIYEYNYSPLRLGEQNASFQVNIEINKYIDFGSGSKGDVIDLVMKMGNISFLEAVKLLQGCKFESSFSFGGSSYPESQIKI